MSFRVEGAVAVGAIISAALLACTTGAEVTGASDSEVSLDPFDVPITGSTPEEVARFNDGDVEFGLVMREGDGLGPLFTQKSCGACHDKATRGPGSVQKMVVVEADGFTPSADQSSLPWGHTVHPLVAGGAHTPVVAPTTVANLKVSIRLGPPTLGRGYMEAVLDSEIERVAREQAARTDGIHGRVNHIVYASEPNTGTTFPTHNKGDIVIGRFGLKARVATLDDFTADAFQGDMGITTPLRPTEIVNPEGLRDDRKPGVDLGVEHVNSIANYLRLVAIPKRTNLDEVGRAAFTEAKCSVCHAPTLHTRPDYAIATIADKDVPLYTDILLHDMGSKLADGMVEGEAGPRDWRTLPLVGLRFQRAYLHDGRAETVEDAIMMHDGPGSEAAESIEIVRRFDDTKRAALFGFVNAL